MTLVLLTFCFRFFLSSLLFVRFLCAWFSFLFSSFYFFCSFSSSSFISYQHMPAPPLKLHEILIFYSRENTIASPKKKHPQHPHNRMSRLHFFAI